MLNFTANSYCNHSLIDREAQVRRGARRQKREESLATRPLGRIFIFADSGFNFRTWGFFMRFKDKPGRGGGLPARPSNPFIKNIHPSNSRSKALAPLSYSPPLPPSLSPPRFFVLSSTCPRLDAPLFHSRYRSRVYLQGFFFFSRAHRVSLFCIFTSACNRQSAEFASDPEFSLQWRASSSSILEQTGASV